MGLKIEINVNEGYRDTEIKISCARLTPEIEKILATLRMLNRQLTAYREGETYLLDVSEVIYAESIDRKTFVYTGKEVYESGFKLYELEQQLEECGFFRANKSCVVQLRCIRSLKMDLNRKIRATLENGEQITGETTFTPEADSGTVDVTFELNASRLAGKTAVAFESVTKEGEEVAAHKDIHYEGQTLYFPELKTQAAEKQTGSQKITAENEITIVDKVTYQNLIPGEEYTIKGILMDRSTGAPLRRSRIYIPGRFPQKQRTRSIREAIHQRSGTGRSRRPQRRVPDRPHQQTPVSPGRTAATAGFPFRTVKIRQDWRRSRHPAASPPSHFIPGRFNYRCQKKTGLKQPVQFPLFFPDIVC